VRERPPGPVLLDTAPLLWWIGDPARLSRAALGMVSSPTQALLVSVVSFWEIGSKVRRGQLGLLTSFEEFVAMVSSLERVTVVPVDLPIFLGVVDLEWDHRDPADRIIVATAQRYRAPLVSSDRAIRAFYQDTVW
jgi:PIN domain nuclease of toxin-antitoxin system